MIAAQNGHFEAAGVLLEAGAAVNLADNYGSTPLHAAAFHSHDTLVRLLLAAGADPNRMTTVKSLFALLFDFIQLPTRLMDRLP
jgi:ankyrin repeat protein